MTNHETGEEIAAARYARENGLAFLQWGPAEAGRQQAPPLRNSISFLTFDAHLSPKNSYCLKDEVVTLQEARKHIAIEKREVGMELKFNVLYQTDTHRWAYMGEYSKLEDALRATARNSDLKHKIAMDIVVQDGELLPEFMTAKMKEK